MKTRIEWIDNLRGIVTILVVLGHLSIPLILQTFIYSFHMPLFFFLSGYLLNKEKFNSMKEFATKKFNSVMIPYFIFAMLSSLIGIANNQLQGFGIQPIKILTDFFYLKGTVGWNSPLWFLVTLFIVEIGYFSISKKSTTLIASTIGILFLMGYGATYLNFRPLFGLDIVLVGLVFYAIGYYTRQHKIIDKLNRSKKITLITLVVTLTINLLFGNMLNVRAVLYHYELGNYLYFYISAIAGTLFMFTLAYNLTKSKWLEYYGKNAVLILSTQYMLFLGYRLIDQKVLKLNVMDKNSLAVAIILTIITLLIYIPGGYVFNRFLPLAMGKKKQRSSGKGDGTLLRTQ